MTSKELDKQIMEKQNDIMQDIHNLSELRDNYKENKEYCRALDSAIEELKNKAYIVGRQYRGC